MILGRVIRGLRRHRLVEIGIERHTDLIDTRDAQRVERLPQLALDHVHTLVDRLRVRLRGIDVREPRQVVERVHKTPEEVGLSPAPQIRALFGGALAEIVVFGGQTEMFVFHIRQLALEAGHRLVRKLHKRPSPGFGRCWALGVPAKGLFWLIVHSGALLGQSACRLAAPFWPARMKFRSDDQTIR